MPGASEWGQTGETRNPCCGTFVADLRPILTTSHRVPKGPFRTKNATTIAKIVKLLRRSVFTTPPRFTTTWTFLGEGKCLEFPGKWCPHKVRRDSKSQGASKNTTRSKFTTRSIFSMAGSFGCRSCRRLLHKKNAGSRSVGFPF